MTVSKSFALAAQNFIQACNAEIDTLAEKIDKEENKETPNEEKIDKLSTLKDDIENAAEAAEEIETE